MDVRAELLALDDVKTKEVEVPVWDRPVTIREMGLQESLAILSHSEDGKVTLTAEDIASVVAACVIDPETGSRVFTDDDVPALARKSRAALMFLYNEITGLSGSVEDAGKN